MKIFHDSETTTKNKGHPFTPSNRMVSYSYVLGDKDVEFKYHTDPDFAPTLLPWEDITEYVGFNCKFDLHWLNKHKVTLSPQQKVWDCMLAEFILSGQTARFISLNETLESYGFPLKHDEVAAMWKVGIDTPDIPRNILEVYGNYDVTSVKQVQEIQQSCMSDAQITLCYLMGEDLKTLQHAEYHGIKWNEAKATELTTSLEAALVEINSSLSHYLPEILYGSFNWDSGIHLSALLYGGVVDFDYVTSLPATYKSGEKKGQAYIKNSWHIESVVFPARFRPVLNTELKKTKDDPTATTRVYQTDIPTLKQLKGNAVNKRLVALLLDRADKTKVVEMIAAIEKKRKDMGWDEYIHAQFNQNVAITGRLSSAAPNMQNTPAVIDQLLVSRYDS